MKVVRYGQHYPFKKPTFILGSFEFFHRGHMDLMNVGRQRTKGDLVLFTFANPQALPKHDGIVFNDLETRLQLFANLGFDAVVIATFENKFRSQSGRTFVNNLVRNYGVEHIVCGGDFRYGHLASNNVKNLAQQFASLTVVPVVKYKNQKVGAYLVKELLKSGHIKDANKLLIQPWSTRATINFKNKIAFSPNLFVLPPGVYFVTVEHKGYAYPALLLHSLSSSQTTLKLIVKNVSLSGLNVTIHWYKTHRFITRIQADGFVASDIDQATKFFFSRQKAKK